MFRLFVVLIIGITVLFSACQPGNADHTTGPMAALEAEVASNPSNESVSALLELYDAWLYEYPDPSPAHRAILEKSLEVSIQHKRLTHALGSLQRLLIDYHSDAQTQSHLLTTADVLSKTGKTAAAEVLYRAFVEKYPSHEGSAEIKVRYPGTVSLDTLLFSLGSQIFSDTSTTINEAAARQYVDACEAYALVYHGSDEAIEYLHKAAETARTLHSTAKSMTLYDWIIKSNPNHKRAAQALFLKGFTYDNNMQDHEAARAVYEEFLKKYPKDEFAESARFLLENLGKTDDELLEALHKRAAQHKN